MAAGVKSLRVAIALLAFPLVCGAGRPEDSNEAARREAHARACPGIAEWEATMATKGAALSQPTQPDLRLRLLKMAEDDQAARAFFGRGLPPSQQEIAEVHRVDARNMPRIKEIVRTGGYPRISEVGRGGSQAAFLLVQHADADPDFQAEVLAAIQPLLQQHEVTGEHVALLTDRVLVAQGKPQRYGTQFQTLDGRNVLTQVEDPAGLDARRAAMDMFPIRSYACVMERSAGMAVDLSVLGASGPDP